MNRLTQSDIHPDADSLSAFAEHALSESERLSVMTHLADCPHCREIVFLAQAAAESEAPTASSLPVSESVPSFGARLAGLLNPWRHVWVPAGALATIGIVTALFVLRPHPPNPTVAQDSAPEQVQPEQAQRSAPPPPAAMQPETSPSSAAKATPPVPHSNEPDIAPRKSLTPMTRAAKAQPPRPEQAPFLPAPKHSEMEDALSSEASLPQIAAAPPPGFAPPQPSQPGTLSLAHASIQPEPQASTRSAQIHGTAIGSVAHASAMRSPLIQPNLKASPAPLALFASQEPVKLPNGLISVSTASAAGRLLALDPNGSLFLSRDAGNEWEPIPSQWSGKATKILPAPRTFFLPQESLLTTEDEASALSSGEPASAPAKVAGLKPPPTVLFRLVNDSHQVWISSDGKVWRPESSQPQPLPQGKPADQP